VQQDHRRALAAPPHAQLDTVTDVHHGQLEALEEALRHAAIFTDDSPTAQVRERSIARSTASRPT
jgi:hypothetical protein